jgi:molecular chaperone Hsp33
MGAVISESARAVQRVQGALPLAAAAMGRLMAGAAFFAADLKDGGAVHLELSGGGPLGRVIAEAYADGLLRARVDHPDVDLPLTPTGKLAVGQAVGRDGQLMVQRRFADGGSYTSYAALATGEVGDDLARFLLESEQIPAAVAVGVLVGRDGWVEAAGGLLVQALPGAPPDLVAETAERVGRLDAVSRRLAAGETPEAMLREVLPAPITWADRQPLAFGCRCDRADLEGLLRALPLEERQDMARSGGAEVVCQYCRTAYRYDPESLLG